MKSVAFFVFAGAFCLVIQCCVLSMIFPMELKPDFTLLLVVWIGLKGEYISGLVSAFALGLMEDLLSGGPLGLFSMLYVLAVIFSSYFRDNFTMESIWAYFAITLLISTVCFGTALLSRWLVGQIEFEPVFIKIIATKAILTCLSLILVKPILDKAWEGYSRIFGAA